MTAGTNSTADNSHTDQTAIIVVASPSSSI